MPAKVKTTEKLTEELTATIKQVLYQVTIEKADQLKLPAHTVALIVLLQHLSSFPLCFRLIY